MTTYILTSCYRQASRDWMKMISTVVEIIFLSSISIIGLLFLKEPKEYLIFGEEI